MSETASKPIRTPLYALVGILIIGGVALLASQGDRPRSLCAKKIAEPLVAPDTLEILEFRDASFDQNEQYRLTYRADNAYGVPLRGSGRCVLSEDRGIVVWYPTPDL